MVVGVVVSSAMVAVEGLFTSSGEVPKSEAAVAEVELGEGEFLQKRNFCPEEPKA